MDKAQVFQNVSQVKAAIDPMRKQGKKLVTTNGCFDLIHAGHVRYLAEAATLGDILVVGVNANTVVRKLKGEGRPVQDENDRCLIVASLKPVFCAFVFEEETPFAFLEVLRPDIHVKGGDYTTDIIEKPVVEKYGGKIVIVSFTPGKSTSNIIKVIRV